MDLHAFVTEIRAKLTSIGNGTGALDLQQKGNIKDALVVLDRLDFVIDHPYGDVEIEAFNLSRLLRVLLNEYYFMVRSRELNLALSGCEKSIQAWGDTVVVTDLVHRFVKHALLSQPTGGKVEVDVRERYSLALEPAKEPDQIVISISAPGMVVDSLPSGPPGSGIEVDVVTNKFGQRITLSMGKVLTIL